MSAHLRRRASRACKLQTGPGKDMIAAAAGAKDTIDCGTGDDDVTADRTDVVARNCEHVHRSNSL